MNRMKRKPDIAYPCSWGYKVIGTSAALMSSAIAAIMQDIPHSVTPSNRSASGRYICLDVDVLVSNEDQRLTLYEALRNHPAVKIVL